MPARLLTFAVGGEIDDRKARAMTSAREDNRILEIDALRGICAFAVMTYHYVIRYDWLVGFHGVPKPPADLLTVATIWSRVPVYVFFIISGFVIRMTVERSRNATAFVVSRASRIFPVYWAAVVITYVAWEWKPAFDFHVGTSAFLVNLTLLQSFLNIPDVDGVYWSLGVELTFYAAMWFLLVSGQKERIQLFCGAWLVLSFLNAVLGKTVTIPYRVILILDLPYAPFFVAGIVFYQIWRRRQGPIDWALLAGCVATMFVQFAPEVASTMMVFFAIFLLVALGRFKRLAAAPLVYLGSISYALYLIHEMIGYQIIKAIGGSPMVGILAAIAAALILAAAITKFIEQPALHAIRAAYKRLSNRPPQSSKASELRL